MTSPAGKVTIDFETRSAASLQRCGGWRYSLHPTTETMCLAFHWSEWRHDEPLVWVPKYFYDLVEDPPVWAIGDDGSMPTELKQAVLVGALVEAHNSFFERSIWKNQMQRKHGWTPVRREQWRCSAAKTASFSLPRKLEEACLAMNVAHQKSMAGNRLMQKMSKPRKPRKAERKEMRERGIDPDSVLLWHEDPGDLVDLWEYCRQDVRSERALSDSLPDLHGKELRIWQADQDINLRGIRVDVETARRAIDIADAATERANRQAVVATGGRVDEETGKLVGGAFDRVSQRDKFLDWVRSRGVSIPNAQGKTMDDLLEGELPDDVRTVIQAKRTCGRTSVKKYESALEMASPVDDRIRDLLMYYGAATGRWTGKGFQPHNLVRGKMKDPDTMCGVIGEGDLAWLETCYDADPMEVLSWAVRGIICATEGRDIIAVDYSAIEARGTMWLVDDERGLEIFSRPKGQPGIYREMASDIYGVDPLTIDKDTHQGFTMRFTGKQAILGLGYGMGAKKFKETCAKFGVEISLEFAKHVVDTYRERFFLVVEFWKDVERAAIRAVNDPGKVAECGKVAFVKRGRFLFCRLPSGRPICYHGPRVEPGLTPWGEVRAKLTYDTVDSTTKKWWRTDTYGGKLTENIVQGMCRDIMADAILKMEDDSPYDVILTVHDEIVDEVDEGVGSVEEVCSIMEKQPDWAYGFPIRAEGWRGKRYRK